MKNAPHPPQTLNMVHIVKCFCLADAIRVILHKFLSYEHPTKEAGLFLPILFLFGMRKIFVNITQYLLDIYAIVAYNEGTGTTQIKHMSGGRHDALSANRQ